MTAHHVRFFRSTNEPGLRRAACSCGWSIEGDEDHVRARAATHNLEPRPARGPPLLREGFVSGLPDRDDK